MAVYKNVKVLILLLCLLIGGKVFADNNSEVLEFFNNFVNLSNQYDLKMLDFYSQNPIIKREVIGKNGALVIVPFSEHKKMQKAYSEHKKLLVNTKNNYKDKKVIELGNNTYKITAQRCPTVMDRCFDSYMIIKKENNTYKISEEYSKVQTTYFLKYKNNFGDL